MTPTTYRYGGLRWWVAALAAVPVVAFGVGLVIRFVADMPVLAPATVLFALLAAALLGAAVLVWRARVIADASGLTIVSPLWSQQVAWDDVATIQVVRERGGFSYPVEVHTLDGRAIRCVGLTAIRTWPVDLTGLERVVAQLEQHRQTHRRQPPPPRATT